MCVWCIEINSNIIKMKLIKQPELIRIDNLVYITNILCIMITLE